MRRPGKDHGFILCYILTLVMNLEWTIPAWILLAVHFLADISIWWFAGAMIIWAAVFLIITAVISFANSTSKDIEAEKENKNPYSSGKYIPSGKTEYEKDK